MPTPNLPSSGTASISWEYLMPKRKERMASYIRESDPRLADSTTIESAAKACRDYGAKEGYVHDVSRHEFKEAISAYEVPYTKRSALLAMLKAAERHEFDVLVVTEIRAISRRQVEVLVIYDMLQRYGIRLETIKEKFGDDAMSKAILSLRAMFVEIEREQSYFRMARGRKDRVEIGQALNGHPQPGYGHVFVDNEREQKAGYALDTHVVYTDKDEKDWTPVDVIHFMRDTLLIQRTGLQYIAYTLTSMGIPTPDAGKKRKGKPMPNVWHKPTVARILKDPRIKGVVYANKYQTVNGKRIPRPFAEWTRLPDCPQIITPEDYDAIQRQLEINKEEALRNNKQQPEERGLFRAGYCYCGICHRRMTVKKFSRSYHYYICYRKTGQTDLVGNHLTSIGQPLLDREGWKHAVEVILNPSLVRERVTLLRSQQKEVVIDREVVTQRIATLDKQIANLLSIAQNATSDDTIAQLGQMLNQLESQKQQALALLYDIADEDEEQEKIEREIVKFETWAEEVRPLLGDPEYNPTPEEKRLAIRILGLRCTVYPEKGDHPFRYQFELAPPEIMKLLEDHCVSPDLSGETQSTHCVSPDPPGEPGKTSWSFFPSTRGRRLPTGMVHQRRATSYSKGTAGAYNIFNPLILLSWDYNSLV